jgi:hypothetical protein
MSKIGSEILVNTQALFDQTLSQSAKLNNGGFVTVWVDWASSIDSTIADGSWSGIKAQVFSATGAKVGVEILVNSATLNWQQDPRVAVLRDGNFVVTWADGWDYFSWADHPGSQGVGGATADNYGKAVKLQVFSANGTPIGTEVVAATEIRTDQTAQKITALTNGNFVVTWEDWSLSCEWAADGSLKSAGGGPGLKAQVFDPAGGKVGAEVAVTGSYNYGPQITNLVNGGFVMTWHDGHYSVDDVKAQVFSDAGAKLGSEILVNTAGAGATFSTQTEERIVALSNGNFAVAWTDNNGDDSNRAIKAQVFNATGDKVGTEILVNTTTLSYQWHPQLAALKNGGFVVTWDNWAGTYPENSGIDVNAQIFDNAGARVGTEILANTSTGGTQGNAQIAALDDGGFAVSWFDSNGAWSGYSGVPRFQVFDALGNKLGTEHTANTKPASGGVSPITALDNGTYVIAWNAGDTSGSAVKAQVFSIALQNNAPSGSVSIAGTAIQGQSLTASHTLADIDGLGGITYQWKADGVAIAGATTATLKLGTAYIGKAIVVTANYTDGDGTAESVASTPTAPIASAPAQTVNGTNANDTLAAVVGNHAVNGLAGMDTAVYSGRMAAYGVAKTVNGYSISDPDWLDTLSNIERAQFADANLAFDLDGNAGQTYRLYQASFNRTPDLGGLGGWIAAMDGGTTPIQVATSFMASAEFQSLYGSNPTNEQFVSLLYTNALHRTADAGGLAYWVNQLTSGLQTRAQVLFSLSESAENKAAVLPAIVNGIVYATATQAAGPAKGQAFNGTTGNDSLIGTVSNDTFTGGAGNDTINGGGGLDTAIYSGTRASHTATNANGALTVSGGSDGTDTLTNVERLKFDNAILAFDTSGNAGQTYRLYQAAFNRTPDKDGLSGWIKGVDSGMTMLKVAAAFIESGEFKTLYGNSPTNSAFVNLLYTNALHRTADAGGLEYWVNQLSSHAQSREQALLGFSESVENQAALIGVIQGGIELTV